MDIIGQHIKELNRLCNKYQVEELFVFGSVLTDKFNPESDIDFIVSIATEDPFLYAEHYFGLKYDMEKLFDRKIDLLEQKAIRNKSFETLINSKKQLVYARRNQGLV